MSCLCLSMASQASTACVRSLSIHQGYKLGPEPSPVGHRFKHKSPKFLENASVHNFISITISTLLSPLVHQGKCL